MNTFDGFHLKHNRALTIWILLQNKYWKWIFYKQYGHFILFLINLLLYQHVGWWSPTIIRGDDREAVHIPNHKFTVNVVRNLSQKTHWRIKTHLAISHLDVIKINVSRNFSSLAWETCAPRTLCFLYHFIWEPGLSLSICRLL